MVEWIKFDGNKEIYTVQCPGCKKLLNSENNDKDIIVDMITEGGSGKLYLSAIWGDYSHSIDGIFVASGEVVEMFCPYCNESLKSNDICPDCGGTTTIFSVSEGYIKICNRNGCKMHLKSQLIGG